MAINRSVGMCHSQSASSQVNVLSITDMDDLDIGDDIDDEEMMEGE